MTPLGVLLRCKLPTWETTPPKSCAAPSGYLGGRGPPRESQKPKPDINLSILPGKTERQSSTGILWPGGEGSREEWRARKAGWEEGVWARGRPQTKDPKAPRKFLLPPLRGAPKWALAGSLKRKWMSPVEEGYEEGMSVKASPHLQIIRCQEVLLSLKLMDNSSNSYHLSSTGMVLKIMNRHCVGCTWVYTCKKTQKFIIHTYTLTYT